jgi:hypothetical protein
MIILLFDAIVAGIVIKLLFPLFTLFSSFSSSSMGMHTKRVTTQDIHSLRRGMGVRGKRQNDFKKKAKTWQTTNQLDNFLKS